MRKFTLSLILCLLCLFVACQVVMADNFAINFELDFFNMGPNVFTTETFMRYHKFTFNYRLADDCNLGFTYDWCDHVTGSISTHKLTPWQLSFTKDIYRLDAVLLSDIVHGQRSYTYNFGAYPSFPIGANDKLCLGIKLGIKVKPEKVIFDLGGIVKKGNFWLGINCLEPIDAKLLDEPDNRANIPLTVGYQWQPREDSSLRFEFNRYLLPSDAEKNSWAKIVLGFKLI